MIAQTETTMQVTALNAESKRPAGDDGRMSRTSRGAAGSGASSRGAVPHTFERYVRHAQRFGTELLCETARQNGLTADELCLLEIECEQIEATRARGRRGKAKPRRRTPEEMLDAVGVLDATGLGSHEIAEKLGTSTQTVERYLRGRAIIVDGGRGTTPTKVGAWT
jgi:hypothetical protein